MEVDLLKEETMGAKFASLESLEPLVGNHSIYSHVFDFEQRFDERKAQGWVQENWVPMTAWAGSVYVILVFSGQAWMASRPAYQLRGPLTAWSAFLAIFSICGFARVFPEFLHTLTTRGFYDSICNTSFVEENKVSSFWTWLFTLSKMPELGDTVFIVLRKQQLIFLHWYHHLTVLVYVFYCFSQFTSCARWFMTMNYFVHSLMYTYFALRAMRVRVPKVVAMIITSLQLVQMVVGCAVNYFAFKFKENGMPCAVSDNNLFYSSLMYSSYFVLFARFFYKAYFCKSERKSLGKEAANGGEPQVNGTPATFGNVLQAGGSNEVLQAGDRRSNDNNPSGDGATKDGDSSVLTKQEETEEDKGIKITDEKHPSLLTDEEKDLTQDILVEDKDADVTTPKEKIVATEITRRPIPDRDDMTIATAQISEKETFSKQNRPNHTKDVDQKSRDSNELDTESKKEK